MMMDQSSPAADSPALTTISEDPSVKESLITSLDSPHYPDGAVLRSQPLQRRAAD